MFTEMSYWGADYIQETVIACAVLGIIQITHSTASKSIWYLLVDVLKCTCEALNLFERHSSLVLLTMADNLP